MSPFSLELPHFMPVTLELQKRGVTYTWEMGDQETEFGSMCNNDVVLDPLQY